MNDTEKREALLILADAEELNKNGPIADKLRAIAADYDDTPADAEWVSKREGWEDSGDGNILNDYYGFKFSTTKVGTVSLWFGHQIVGVNPTRGQDIRP